jgi:hypothetical protein
MTRTTGGVRLVCVLACLFVSERVASAQSAGYVGVTGFADIRQFGSSTSGFYGSTGDFALDSTGVGGGVRIATFLHSRWSLELGVDLASRETVDVDDPVVILIYPPPPRRDLQASSSFVNASTMVGFHPPAMGRVRLGYRAGFSFVRATYKSNYGYPYPAPLSTPARAKVVPPATTFTQNTGALTLGFDAAIDLTSRFSIVPEIRALVFETPNDGSGVFLIRPGVGVRWKF